MMALLILLVCISVGFLLYSVSDFLNFRWSVKQSIPAEFRGLVTEEKFATSQNYLQANTKYSLLERFYSYLLVVACLVFGIYGYVDFWSSNVTEKPLLQSLIFIAILTVLNGLAHLPFSLYHTFVIEEKFGFNRTTIKTFFADRFKGIVLGVLIGGPILYLLLFLFERFGTNAWVWAWLALAVLQIVLMFLAPAFIMPLFYKFSPLADGELKQKIKEYAATENFSMEGVYVMDGSKRSAKANAFFTGFGSFRKIVLFDTLVKQHTTNELLAVLAHEVGHFKLGHILKNIFLSLCSSLVMFYLFSIVLRFEGWGQVLGMNREPLHAALLAATFLFEPISIPISILGSFVSRKFEFEADAFAAKTTGQPMALAEALKRLSVDSLSNLNPHPFKVFLEYSHPPVTQRLAKLR